MNLITEIVDTPFAARVRQRLQDLNKRPNPTSIEAGLGKDFIRDILIGKKRSVYGENLEKLAQVLDVTTDWLARSMEDESNAHFPDFDDRPTVRKGDASAFLTVPEYDIKVSAGGGYVIDREALKAEWPFNRAYIENELRLSPGALSMVEVRGDSMEPLLRTGDRVVVDHGDNNPASGGIFVIWDGSATVVKRLEMIPYSQPPKVVLISENKAHNQYTVNADVVNIVGRVVWVARRL